MVRCLQEVPAGNESRARKEKMMKWVFQTLAIDRDWTSYEQDIVYILLLLEASDFFSWLSLQFDSIQSKIWNDKSSGASTRHLIQMSHFITKGVIKLAELLSLFEKNKKNIFLSKTCYRVKFLWWKSNFYSFYVKDVNKLVPYYE